MGQTITEKIVANHLIRGEAIPGRQAVVSVDVLLTHDVCGPPTADIHAREFGKDAPVFDRNGVVIIPDHYIFTKDATAARNVEALRRFALAKGISHFYDVGKDYKGVCHVALPQERLVHPGDIIVGTDSHTTTHGAFGTLSIGVGNTTGAYVMGAGHIIINTPESVRFRFSNEFPKYVMGKDVILRVIGDIGTDGADFKSMEFCGEAIQRLGMAERMTICNMAIEAGGNGIIAPDGTTYEFMWDNRMIRQGEGLAWGDVIQELKSDSDADYFARHDYDGSKLEPVAACPHSPGNVKRVRDLDVRLDSVYIGSCTGGKTEDFLAAAHVLKQARRQVAVPLLLVPATRQTIRELKQASIQGTPVIKIFRDAGADMTSFYEPSCAACLGGPKDTYGRINDQPNHVRASTTNRNFPKRMGSGSVYLVSPLTAAASALTGKLTDPREYMR